MAKAPAAAKAVDDADEAAARDIFNLGSPVLLDLDDLMPHGAGRFFMAKPGPLATAPPSLPVAPSLPNTSRAASTTETTMTDDNLFGKTIFVLAPIGDTLPDSISVGVYVGDWKTEVFPEIVRLHNLDQLTFDKTKLKPRMTRVRSFEDALAKCRALDIEPVYLGPVVLDGLEIGGDLAEYVDESGSESMSEPSTDHNDDDDDDDSAGSEPDEEAESEPESEPESNTELDELVSQVESYTVNTHLHVIKQCIRRNHLLRFNGAPIWVG